MRRLLFAAPFLLALCALTAGQARAAGDFRLTSPQISDGAFLGQEQVFNGFGCTGKNVSPALNWSNPPKGAKSFALTVYDPDAPTGSGWWHWVVFDIPAASRSLPLQAAAAGRLPRGTVESLTDFGAPGYGGACPPPGDNPHRYIFTLYALATPRLDMDATAMPAQVGFALHALDLEGKVLGKATLTARYGR